MNRKERREKFKIDNEKVKFIAKIISPKEKNYINKDKAKTQRKNKLILFMLVVFLIFYYLLYYFF